MWRNGNGIFQEEATLEQWQMKKGEGKIHPFLYTKISKTSQINPTDHAKSLSGEFGFL
jgi:hypothetical protein